MQALSSMLMRPIVSHSKHNVFFDINLIDFWLFDNEYKNSGENLQDVLFCNNSKKETSFPTIEEQMSAFPFLSPHKHYSAFIEEHPGLSVSPSTVNKSVNEKGGVDFVACLLVCTSIFGIVFQKFSCTRLEEERRVKRTFSYVVDQFDR